MEILFEILFVLVLLHSEVRGENSSAGAVHWLVLLFMR